MFLGYAICTTDKCGVPTYLEYVAEAQVNWGPAPMLFGSMTEAIVGMVNIGRALERAENEGRIEDVLESYDFLKLAVICPVRSGPAVE